MTRDNKDLLVGLDIGTSKVVAIVAELHADGEIEVIGTGQHESNGLKKGVVVDIEKTVASIQAALEKAEITSLGDEPGVAQEGAPSSKIGRASCRERV